MRDADANETSGKLGVRCPVSSEDVPLKNDTHYCKNWLAGCRRWN